MALLTGSLRRALTRRTASALALACASAALALAGCVLFQDATVVRRSYAFSHKVHGEQELACADCHRGAETKDEPGMPSAGQCNLCHADLDEPKPADRRVATLFEGKDFKAVRASAQAPAIVFPHLRHVAAGLDCAACHADVATNEDAVLLAPARMDDCFACHAERGVANDCATCHPGILATTPPASHDGNWTKRHGETCRARGDATTDRCTLCHQETDCASCHLTTPPENHTNQWRRAGHGFTAALDRDSCSTCHQPSACLACHMESRPRSHVGSFGSPRNEHCVTCHEPLAGEGCSACHASTPSHALAPPKPAGHVPAMNCRQCHLPGGVLPPMPHADDGSNCNRCHS